MGKPPDVLHDFGRQLRRGTANIVRPWDHGVAGTGRTLRIWLTISIASRCAAAGPSIAVTFPVPRTMPVFGLIIFKI